MAQSKAKIKKLNILAVDDDQTIIKLYNSILGEDGHNITVAKDGKEAIEKVKDKAFDLVILDLVLPDMHGNDILNKIHDTLEGVPVIIVTANPSLESSIEAIRTGGVYEYIIKPFDPKEIRMLTLKVVEKAELTNENRRLVKKLKRLNEALSERVGELEEIAKEAFEYVKKIKAQESYIKELEGKLKSARAQKKAK